jgi:hypothetical protein
MPPVVPGARQPVRLQVVATIHPVSSRARPRAARRAQLSAPARVSRSVMMRSLPRVRACRPPQARRTKWGDLALDGESVSPVALEPARVGLFGPGTLEQCFVGTDGDRAPGA